MTSGNWEVLGRNIWIDSSRELIYFLGLRETPLEKHLYVVGLRQPNDIRLLTEPGSSYVVELDEVNSLSLSPTSLSSLSLNDHSSILLVF